MTVTPVTRTDLRVPYVIAYSGEAIPQQLTFQSRTPGGARLSYVDSHRGDEVQGVLRARVRENRTGSPQWRKLNTLRQWRCMEKALCQVCGRPATDAHTGRILWIITATAFRQIVGHTNMGYTNAPPTCLTCIPEALATCPQLHTSADIYSVGRSDPAAILADMFVPGLNRRAVPTGEHNVFVHLSWTDLLPYALATQLIVRLHDLQPLPPSSLLMLRSPRRGGVRPTG
jgi:hypothetical protein